MGKNRRTVRRGFGLVLWAWAVAAANWCQGVVVEQPEATGEATPELEFPVLNPPSPELPPAGENGPRELWYLFQDSRLDLLGERYAEFKQRDHIPITVSAWNWWHVNTGGPLDSGYGIPSTANSAYPPLPGTYFYSLEAAPEFDFHCGPFTKFGSYSDVRFRDGGTPLRPFYPNDTCWLQQGYVWASADFRVLKAGSINRRFGLDWDGSWWGNTAYFDGFMLAQAWGVSWEVTPPMSGGFKVNRFLQFFVHDYLDGSLVGADPESVIGSSERDMFVARVVPTMQLSPCETLAVGISTWFGRIEDQNQLALVGLPYTFASPSSQTHSAVAIDATYTRGRLKVFAEGLESYGVLSPSSYVSFGASDRVTDALVGFNWTNGPTTYRFCYSASLDSNPSGTQHLFVPGVTLALTRNAEFYAEYVRQEVRHSGEHGFTTLENGMQFLLHWHF